MQVGPVVRQPWRSAWEQALYGPGGFYRRSRPAEHFRTAVTSPVFCRAVRRLAGLVDDALGRPDPFDLVDLGAGGGELLTGLPDVPARWRLTGVDLAPARTAHAWRPDVPPLTGLLLAHEWLDVVPLDVVEDGRLVLVGPDGSEAPGPRSPYDEWCARWWPGPGRVEVGLPRDLAWAAAVGQVRRGLAVAVDYGHRRDDRRPTLTGYRDGRQVPPVPDGRCDLTAHVALDACAAATGARVVTQRDALARLGVDGALPVWRGDGPAYARGLQDSSQATWLRDPGGLGGFGWLVRAVGVPDPFAGCPPWPSVSP